MAVKIALGLQWGDEGKGKIIDYLSKNADIVVRAAGGANAGHTIKTDGKKYILHLIPSGIVHPQNRSLMGGGMVVDPWSLIEEIDGLIESGITNIWSRLGIAPNGHMILPWHREVEKIRENKPDAIGTTHRGIGPSYESKASRFGLPLALLAHPQELKIRLERLLQDLEPVLKTGEGNWPSVEEVFSSLMDISEKIVNSFANIPLEIVEGLEQKKEILLEGAQGSLLDLSHGTYPFVTSSSTITGGILSGCGVGPSIVSETVGVVKAYTTRVGNGPFPTELFDENGSHLAKVGKEFGATTGRQRRCGWLDIVALRHTLRLTGTTALAVTKVDVLGGMKEIKVCTAYETPSGEIIREYPADPYLIARMKPVYETLPSWNKNPQKGDIPKNLMSYIKFIEEKTGVPVKILSHGPDRSETIDM
jgi:adenylosuccinate synthase